MFCHTDTLTPLQYDVGKVKRGEEGFREVRSIDPWGGWQTSFGKMREGRAD